MYKQLSYSSESVQFRTSKQSSFCVNDTIISELSETLNDKLATVFEATVLASAKEFCRKRHTTFKTSIYLQLQQFLKASKFYCFFC